MKWVTREKAKVDRIACPWLITKFVDPKAEFLFVPREKVLDVAKERGAIPYDSPGAELFHYKQDGDERCSFDAISTWPRSCARRTPRLEFLDRRAPAWRRWPSASVRTRKMTSRT